MLNIDISCPYCSKPVESGKPPGTVASKYAKRGPYYLCPHCSGPIEFNNNVIGSPLSWVGSFIGSGILVIPLLYVQKYQPQYTAFACIIFVAALFTGIAISHAYSPKRVRWLKRETEL
jgi:hypothetical protein